MPQKISDWENAKALYPSVKHGVEEWVDFFDERPDVLHAILGDIYVVTKFDDAKREGKGRDGRRVMPKDANLADLWDMITPKYSMDPFAIAFKELQGDRSLRAMSFKTGIDHRELSRMLLGKQILTLYVLDTIATKLRVNPSFFLEWRIMYVQQTLGEIMQAKPNLSIGVVKRLTASKGAR